MLLIVFIILIKVYKFESKKKNLIKTKCAKIKNKYF